MSRCVRSFAGYNMPPRQVAKREHWSREIQRHPGDAKYVTEILGRGKNKEARGDKIYGFVSR